jgi:hypothetical protein
MENSEREHYEMQNYLQQNQLDAQQSQNAPQLYESFQQNQAILVEQTNPNKIVNDILLRLRGVEKRPDGTIVRVSRPKVNNVGLENISFILKSQINQNIILSHLEEQEVRNLILSLSDDLVDALALNWREWGIKNKTDLDDINNCILVNIYMALKRALMQGEKNWLGKISIENISAGNRMPSMKKDSFWSKFKI